MTATFKLLALVGIAEPSFEPPEDDEDVIDKLVREEKEKKEHNEDPVKSHGVADDDQPEATA